MRGKKGIAPVAAFLMSTPGLIALAVVVALVLFVFSPTKTIGFIVLGGGIALLVLGPKNTPTYVFSGSLVFVGLLVFINPGGLLAVIEDTQSGHGYYMVGEGLLVGTGSFTTRVGHSEYAESGSLQLTSPSIDFQGGFTETHCDGIGGKVLRSGSRYDCSIQEIDGCELVDSEVSAPVGVDASVYPPDTTLTLWTVTARQPGVNYESNKPVGVKVVFSCPTVWEYYQSGGGDPPEPPPPLSRPTFFEWLWQQLKLLWTKIVGG